MANAEPNPAHSSLQRPDAKRCRSCGVLKPMSDFYGETRGGYRSRCSGCYAAHNRAQRAKHQEKRNAYDRARGSGWDRSGRAQWDVPERQKHDNYLRRTYGISIDEYDAMFAAQGNRCAICRGECNRSTTDRLCVDHDHDLGRVRGLLCFQCNVGLGKFKDDPALLTAAVQYLKEQKTCAST